MVDEYKIKLKPYCSFEDSLVRSNPRNAQDVRAQVEDEEVAMMKLIGSDDLGINNKLLRFSQTMILQDLLIS